MARPAGRVRRFSKSRGSGRVGSGQEVLKSHRSGLVGSGVFLKYHRSGGVGSTGFKMSRVGSGPVKRFHQSRGLDRVMSRVGTL